MHGDTLHQAKSKVEACGGRTACAEKGEGDAHHGEKIEAHAQIKRHLGSDHPKESIADAAAERFRGMARDVDRAHQQQKEQYDNQHAADKTKLFACHGEDIVALLDRDAALLYARIRREEATTPQLPAADRNFSLQLL